MKEINGFDCDGVITVGIHPGPDDIIITGRSWEEKNETRDMLTKRGIKNIVLYNELDYKDKTRKTSGIHKGVRILQLKDSGTVIKNFFEDDPIQIREIERLCPWVNIVHIVHELTEKENVKHVNDY